MKNRWRRDQINQYNLSLNVFTCQACAPLFHWNAQRQGAESGKTPVGNCLLLDQRTGNSTSFSPCRGTMMDGDYKRMSNSKTQLSQNDNMQQFTCRSLLSLASTDLQVIPWWHIGHLSPSRSNFTNWTSDFRHFALSPWNLIFCCPLICLLCFSQMSPSNWTKTTWD